MCTIDPALPCCRSVLCPGLGTAVGRMPVLRCAIQMRVAYEAVMFGSVDAINRPPGLSDCCSHHVHLYQASAYFIEFYRCRVAHFAPFKIVSGTPHAQKSRGYAFSSDGVSMHACIIKLLCVSLEIPLFHGSKTEQVPACLTTQAVFIAFKSRINGLTPSYVVLMTLYQLHVVMPCFQAKQPRFHN